MSSISEKRLGTVSSVLQSNLGQTWRGLLVLFLVLFIIFLILFYFAAIKTTFDLQLTPETSRKVFLINLTSFNIVVFIVFFSVGMKLYKMYKAVADSDDSNNVKTLKASFIFGSAFIILLLIGFLVYFDFKQLQV